MLLVHLASSLQHSYSVLIWQIQPVGVVVVQRPPWDWEVVSLILNRIAKLRIWLRWRQNSASLLSDLPPSVPDWSDLGSFRVTVTFTVKVTAKTVNQRSESDKAELLRPIVGFMISWPGRSEEYKTVPAAFLLGSERQGGWTSRSPNDCQASPKWFLGAAFACLCPAGDSQ